MQKIYFVHDVQLEYTNKKFSFFFYSILKINLAIVFTEKSMWHMASFQVLPSLEMYYLTEI